MTSEEIDPDFSRHYQGPFADLKSARKEGLGLVNGDIGEFKRMKQDILSRPLLVEGGKSWTP